LCSGWRSLSLRKQSLAPIDQTDGVMQSRKGCGRRVAKATPGILELGNFGMGRCQSRERDRHRCPRSSRLQSTYPRSEHSDCV
jgi:hypothetical protein